MSVKSQILVLLITGDEMTNHADHRQLSVGLVNSILIIEGKKERIQF